MDLSEVNWTKDSLRLLVRKTDNRFSLYFAGSLSGYTPERRIPL
jgi:hypothetical protein